MKKEDVQHLISWLNEQIEFTSQLIEQAHQTKNYGREVQYEAMITAYYDCLNHLPNAKN